MKVVVLAFLLYGFVRGQEDDIGRFIQFGDVFLDDRYQEQESCLGIFGEHNCGSPFSLLRSAIYAMRRFCENPDFIVLNGGLSFESSDTSSNDMLNRIGNVTAMVDIVFASAKPNVYPVIGITDLSPDATGTFEPTTSSIYASVGSIWHDWLCPTGSPCKQLASFNKAGYYSTTNSGSLKIIGLNTNIYAERLNSQPSADPLGQFTWLEHELIDARSGGQRVILIGHLPPGQVDPADYPERQANFGNDFNERFVHLTAKYQDIIVAGFYGHRRVDDYSVARDWEGRAVAPTLVAPSIAPFGGRNPAFRVYDYDKRTMQLVNYRDYYLDLERANEERKANWTLLYDFANEFGQRHPLTGPALDHLTDRLSKNESLWRRWQQLSTADYTPSTTCSGGCRARSICSKWHALAEPWRQCVVKFGAELGDSSVGHVALLVLVWVAILLGPALLIAYRCRRRLARSNYETMDEPVDAPAAPGPPQATSAV